MKALLFVFLGLYGFGCAGPAPQTSSVEAGPAITVDGMVTARGNMPFVGMILETDQHNLYVLVLDEAAEERLMSALPGRYRVTGVVYADDWNGRRLAHLRATSIEEL